MGSSSVSADFYPRSISAWLRLRFGFRPQFLGACTINRLNRFGFINPSPNRRRLDCSPTPTSCLPQHWTQNLLPRVRSWIEIYHVRNYRLQAGRTSWKSTNPASLTRDTGTYTTQNVCARCFHFSPKFTKILAAGAPPQTPLGELTALSQTPLAAMVWDGDLITTLVGSILCPIACDRSPCCFQAGYRPGHRMFDCLEMHICMKHAIYYRPAITLNVAN